MIALLPPNHLIRQQRSDGGYDMVPAYTADEVRSHMLSWAENRVAEERERLRRDVEVLVHERDQARARYDHATKMLVGIHSLLYPAPLTMADGHTMVFRPENPHEFMQELSDRIRALPEQMS